MTQEKKATIEKKYAAAYVSTYESVPDKYHYFIVDIEQRKNIGTKQDECWITVTVPYFPVSGRQKWAEDEHKEAEKKFFIIGQTNNGNEPKIVTVNIPVWAMPAPAASANVISSDGINHKSEATLQMQILVPANSHYCLLASPIRGIFDGIAGIKTHKKEWGIEDAETSALGRALGKAGYGNNPSGISSFEEVAGWLSANKSNDRPQQNRVEVSKTNEDPKKEKSKQENVNLDVSGLKRLVKEDFDSKTKKEKSETLSALRQAMNISEEKLIGLFKSIKGIAKDEKLDKRTISEDEIVQAYLKLAAMAKWGE